MMAKSVLQRMFLASLAFAVLGACGNRRNQNVSEAPEAPKVQQSFKFVPKFVNGNLGHIDNDYFDVYLNESALGQKFLLQTNMVAQTVAPFFTGMRSVVVTFEKSGGVLRMFEVPTGHAVAKGHQPRLLRAEFPIVSKPADGWIAFDFNVGMSKLFVAADWYASDFGGTAYSDEVNWAAAPMSSGFLESASFAGNILWLKQTATIAMSGLHLPFQVHYYLQPYAENVGFVPMETNSKNIFGYFEVNPTLDAEAGLPKVLVSKFDTRKPIVWAISDNTPGQYRDAIRDGILYWNQAFGSEVLQVIEAPAGVAAPHPSYNLIQWTDWDLAGFAYADAQMDPLTGEILHGQVFMTSAWANMGAKRGMASADQKSSKALSLNGLQRAPLGCEMKESLEFKTQLNALLAKNPTPQQLEKLAQEYIRVVIAHEVGHVLGLRHNFAGSTVVNYGPQERHEHFQNLLAGKDLPLTLNPTSSVMEYPHFYEDMFAGHFISKKAPAFDYDAKAIRHLYKDENFAAWEVSPFCTDSHIGLYIDCWPNDVGYSAFEAASFQNYERVNSMVGAIITELIANRVLFPRLGVDEISLGSPSLYANMHAEPVSLAAQALQKGSVSIRLKRNFHGAEIEYGEILNQLLDESLQESVKTLGGFSKVMSLPDLNLEKEVSTKLISRLDAAVAAGMDHRGRSFSFSTDEIKRLKTRLTLWSKEYAKQLTSAWIKGLKGSESSSWRDSEWIHSYATFLQGVAETVLLSHKTPISGGFDFLSGEIPSFVFTQANRQEAVSLLKARGENSSWGVMEQAAVKAKYQKFLDQAARTKTFAEVKIEELTEKERLRWYLENKDLLDQF